MRGVALLLMLALVDPIASAQERPSPPASGEPVTGSTTTPTSTPGAAAAPELPVSLDRIRKEVGRSPAISLESVRDQPTFRIEVQERNRLQDLLLTLDFSSGPTPGGGIYAAEIQRVMFPSVSNPLRQPLAAFNQPELITILIQTIAGTYIAKKAVGAITDADRAAAEEAAKEELKRAITLYCGGQPNNGAGITICSDGAVR
jgi:hypothetical protein